MGRFWGGQEARFSPKRNEWLLWHTGYGESTCRFSLMLFFWPCIRRKRSRLGAAVVALQRAVRGPLAILEKSSFVGIRGQKARSCGARPKWQGSYIVLPRLEMHAEICIFRRKDSVAGYDITTSQSVLTNALFLGAYDSAWTQLKMIC